MTTHTATERQRRASNFRARMQGRCLNCLALTIREHTAETPLAAGSANKLDIVLPFARLELCVEQEISRAQPLVWPLAKAISPPLLLPPPLLAGNRPWSGSSPLAASLQWLAYSDGRTSPPPPPKIVLRGSGVL
jgi:hypothetical protein